MSETQDDPVEDSRLARARRRAESTWSRIHAARPDTPVIDTGFETWERDSATGGSLLAGAIAFRLFLVLVPLLLVAYSALGFFSADASRDLVDTGTSVGLSDAMINAMSTVGETAAKGRWVTLLVGLGALVVAVRTSVKSVRLVHQLAWRLPQSPMRNQLLATLVGVGVILGISVATVGSQWVRARTPGAGLGASVLIGSVVALIWLGIGLFLPRDPDSNWVALVPGAVVVGVASQALHAFTVFYLVGRVDRMSSTYGPMGVAVVVLLWLFVLGRSIVGAAMLNATLWDRRSRGLRNYAPIDPGLFRMSEKTASAQSDPHDDVQTRPAERS